MIRATMNYGLLLGALMGAAWIEWTNAPEVDHGAKVELLPGAVDDITEIRWTSEKNEATLTRRSDERGTYYWVDYVRWTTKAIPKPPEEKDSEEAGESPEPEPEPERIAKPSQFKAGSKIDELIADLSPMLALRRLDVTDPAKLEEIGLSEPVATLDIVRGERTQSLDVGGEAYGSRHIYVRKQADGQIYLVERQLFQILKYARSRLSDHDLFSIEGTKIRTAIITAPDGAISVVQKNADDKDKAQWVHADNPDTVAEQLTTWMGKALKLKSSNYASPKEEDAALEERFRLVVEDGAGTTETLVVLQAGGEGDWFGHSEHTRGQVKLIRSTAKSLTEDVRSLFGE